MDDSITPPPRSPVRPITWVGLFIALFGMLLVRQAANHFWTNGTFTCAIAKEIGMWIIAAALIAIIKLGEGLPLSSAGVGTRWGRSIGRGFLVAIVCLVVGGTIGYLTHFHGGEAGDAMAKLPIWLLNLIVIRAGVVEELCYRGYAIERLQAVGVPRALAAAIPLVIFGLGHWTGGWANIVIALALGAILAAFYLWRRDLVANMIGHWFVDFLGVVLPKLVH